LHIDLSKAEQSKALNDEERLQEDLRLLYVALTRARHACWLGVAPVKFGGAKTCQLEKSAMGALLDWQGKMPPEALAERLIQLKGDCASIAIAGLPDIGDEPYRPLQAGDGLEAARDAKTPIASNWWVASYSHLPLADTPSAGEDKPHSSEEPETAGDDKQGDEADIGGEPSGQPLAGIHGLPRGAGPGVLIHGLLEQCAQLGFANVSANPFLQRELIDKRFTAGEWANKQNALISALAYWLNMPLLEDENLRLASLSVYQAELEFLIGADAINTLALDRLVTRHVFSGQARPGLLPRQINGLLKGFIDLVFEHDGRYYIIDYKFNSLGNNDAAYSAQALQSAMLVKRYDLQYSLYLLALHRLLKLRLGERYDYENHIGGALYLFLRGSRGPVGGKVFDKPARSFIESLDEFFAGETA
jgi:exodeoxyribonuclease V beta subunit